jgi:hypothetical protein
MSEDMSANASTTAITVWRTVEIGRYGSDEIGRYRSGKKMRTAIERFDNIVTGGARCILAHMPFSRELKTLQLVVLSVDELGFPEVATTEQIFGAGPACGLECCPAEVGPMLREQYQDQPFGEKLHIAMDPIEESGIPCVFLVDHDSFALHLNGTEAHPDLRWDPDDLWVFVLPSKQ